MLNVTEVNQHPTFNKPQCLRRGGFSRHRIALNVLKACGAAAGASGTPTCPAPGAPRAQAAHATGLGTAGAGGAPGGPVQHVLGAR